MILKKQKNFKELPNFYYLFQKERRTRRIINDERINQFEELQLIERGEGLMDYRFYLIRQHEL